jgi:hypothetical protein
LNASPLQSERWEGRHPLQAACACSNSRKRAKKTATFLASARSEWALAQFFAKQASVWSRNYTSPVILAKSRFPTAVGWSSSALAWSRQPEVTEFPPTGEWRKSGCDSSSKCHSTLTRMTLTQAVRPGHPQFTSSRHANGRWQTSSTLPRAFSISPDGMENGCPRRTPEALEAGVGRLAKSRLPRYGVM